MDSDLETYQIDKLMESLSDSRWEGVEAYIALSASLRTTRVLTSIVEDELEDLGINWSRFECLMMLRFSKDGALSLGKLSERLLVHPTSVTNTIDKLEADGYVRRVPHHKDRRAILAQITDEGHELVRSAATKLHQIQYGFAGSSKEGLLMLIRICVEFGFMTARNQSIENFDITSMENILDFMAEIFLEQSNNQVISEISASPLQT